VLSHIGKYPHGVLVEKRPERVVHRLKFQIDQGVFEAGNATSVEVIAEAVPWFFGGGPLLVPVHEDVALIGMEVERETSIGYIAGAAEVFEAGE